MQLFLEGRIYNLATRLIMRRGREAREATSKRGK